MITCSDCKIQTKWVPWLQNPAPYNNAGFQIRNALDSVVLLFKRTPLQCRVQSVEDRKGRVKSFERVERFRNKVASNKVVFLTSVTQIIFR